MRLEVLPFVIVQLCCLLPSTFALATITSIASNTTSSADPATSDATTAKSTFGPYKTPIIVSIVAAVVLLLMVGLCKWWDYKHRLQQDEYHYDGTKFDFQKMEEGPMEELDYHPLATPRPCVSPMETKAALVIPPSPLPAPRTPMSSTFLVAK